MYMEAARQKLADLMGPLQLAQLQQQIKQQQAPQFQGTAKTPGGGEAAIIRDPEKGTITTQDILPGIKMPDVDARISKMIQNAPTHQAKLLLQSIRERVNDPNGDPAAILKDAETAYSKYIEQGKPQKKDEVSLTNGTITHYDEEGNATTYPIFKGGKINPDLLDAQRELAESAIQSNQNKFDQQAELQKQRMDAYANAYAKMRGQVYQYSVIDKNTGEPIMVNADTINENPGRYMAGSLGQTLRNREGVFDSIKYASDQFQDALLGTPDPKTGIRVGGLTENDFKTLPRLQIAMALQDRDPKSAISQFIGSEVGSTLTPAQIDYITGLLNLTEDAMSLRSIGGQGQGSDMLRRAILAMLPGPTTPSKAYAMRQMQLFNGTVDKLHTAIPQSIQNSMGGNAPQVTAPPPGAKVRDYSQIGR